MLEEHKRKNGVIPVIFNYHFEDKRSSDRVLFGGDTKPRLRPKGR